MCGALRKLSPAQIECARKLFPVFSNTEHGDITTAALCELEEHDGPHRGFVVPLMHAAAVWAEWTDTSTRTMLRARPDCGSRIWVDGQPDDCVLFASHPGLCTHSYASLDMTAY
ncbi:hypothetical protein OG711_15680 [Streptomyces uncialis]|uniref:hypothetical protein n=2 Tax=Streptomyces TaxID=1883 RepID=UPI002E33673E|nr:hypothetical protein [Streptomyces uncialis]